jgi:hypothetical protein
MSTHAPFDDLVGAVRRFCDRHDMPKSRFGELALSDPSFVSDLEAGREPRRKTRDRVISFMRQHELGVAK